MAAVSSSSRTGSFVSKFTVLRGAVPELWIIFGTKLLAISAYGVTNFTVVLWLSADLGYGDTRAGMIIAAWSALLSLFTVLVGSFVDAIGLRKAFLLGFSVCIASRFIMAFATGKWVALSCGLLPLALGEALMTPVMVTAVKRYSTTAQRSMAFSTFYVMMNLGFAIAGWIFDQVRVGLGEYGHYTLPMLGATLSTYRTLLLIGFLFSIPGLLIISLGLRDGVEVTDEGVRIEPRRRRLRDRGLGRAVVTACRDALRDTRRIFALLWRQPALYRFLVFLTLVVGVRLILYHMFYTFPKYGIRELGEGAPVGRLFSVLNPTLIVVLVPFVGALTQRISAYHMVTAGSLIAALSVFFIAVPPELFKVLADGWLGDLIAHTWLGVQGGVNPLYVGIFLFVLFLSIGESLWSPRLYEYTAAVAPKGQEGSYMSLSVLPFFVAKLFVGTLSGLLLASYCPETGPRDSETMWLIIGLMAMITPAGLLLLRRYIQAPEAGRTD